MKKRSVVEVASYVKDKFKIEMELYEVIQNCAEALKLLKKYAIGEELIITTVKDHCVKLQGAYLVQGVIRIDEPVDIGFGLVFQDIEFPPQVVFEMPAPDDPDEDPISWENNYIPQLKGPYIDYVWDCPHVRFNETDVKVGIYATSVRRDSSGYPMIPDLAFYACAYFCMYSYHLPLFLLGKVEPFVWKEIVEMKNNKFAQARADMNIAGLTNNEADKLFSIMASMDRKGYRLPV